MHLLTRTGSATFEDDEDDEEELVWEDTEATVPNSTSSADTCVGDEALISKIKELETENDILRNEINQLRAKVAELQNLLVQHSIVTTPISEPITPEPVVEIIPSNATELKEIEKPPERVNSLSQLETSSLASSDGSIMLVKHKDTIQIEEPEKKVPISSNNAVKETEKTKYLASLDDEEDEDGWS